MCLPKEMMRINESIDYLTKYAYGGECGQDAARHLIKLLAELDFLRGEYGRTAPVAPGPVPDVTLC